MALAATEPDRAVREIEALENAAAGETLPAALLAEARAQTFIRLVNAGAYEAAERLAARVAPGTDAGVGDITAEALDSLYCLGMLALQRERPAEAAIGFARVQRLAGRSAEIHELARLHEDLGLRRGRPGLKRIAMLFRRSQPRRPFVVAERFVSPVARLAAVVVPLDVIARQPATRRRFLLLAEGGANGTEYRAAVLSNPLSSGDSLRLEFAPFDETAGTSYCLGVLNLSGEDGAPVEVDARALRAAAAGRPPIARMSASYATVSRGWTDTRRFGRGSTARSATRFIRLLALKPRVG